VNDKTWQIGCNDIVFLPAADSTVTLYPFFYTYNGQYKVTKNIAPPPGSDILARPLVIYTPPSYYENTYKPQKNVLIMQDGQNLFDDKTSFAGLSWHCQDTVDQLVVQGRMEVIFSISFCFNMCRSTFIVLLFLNLFFFHLSTGNFDCWYL
jgi:hypothetical protein